MSPLFLCEMVQSAFLASLLHCHITGDDHSERNSVILGVAVKIWGCIVKKPLYGRLLLGFMSFFCFLERWYILVLSVGGWNLALRVMWRRPDMVSLLSEYEGVVRRHQHQDNINDIKKVFEKDIEICFSWVQMWWTCSSACLWRNYDIWISLNWNVRVKYFSCIQALIYGLGPVLLRF